MKILFLHLCAPYNIGWTYRENILPKYLSKIGNQVVVITTENVTNSSTNKSEIELRNGKQYDNDIRVIRLKLKFNFLPESIKSRLRVFSNLSENIKNFNPDLIYVNSLQFLDLHCLTKYKSKHKNVVILGELNSTFLNSANNPLSKYVLHSIVYRLFIKKNFNTFDKLYYGSIPARDFSNKLYSLYFPDDAYIPLAVDSDRIIESRLGIKNQSIREKYEINPNSFLFVTGGKLNQSKKIIELLTAFSEIQNNKIALIVFGDFDNDLLRHANDIIKKDHRISYTGWLGDEDTYRVLSASDLAIFPGSKSSLWEVAVACGLPLIAKYWPGNEYLDFNGNVIYYEDQSSISTLKNWIEYVIANPDIIQKMKAISMEYGLSNLSYRSIADRIMADYEKIKFARGN